MSLGPAANYTDGVPVKISEKYKPPPPISVPSGLFERVSTLSNYVQSVKYDFTLENNVLRKLEEWRNAKETIVNERNHRLQLKEEARQRHLDQIAADQEKLKQLSVSEVSYPSTEEISEISPDDGLDCDRDNKSEEQDKPEETCTHTSPPTNNYSEPIIVEEPSNILQPIPAPRNGLLNQFNLLDDLDHIKRFQQQNTRMKSKLSHVGCNNVDNLNVSDFENDTSSPFDNLELKTINDLELLAQVLNNQSINTNSNTDNINGYVNNTQPYKEININDSSSPCQIFAANPGKADMYSPVQYTVPINPVINSSIPYSMSSTYIPNNQYQSNKVNYNENMYYAPNYAYTTGNMIYQQTTESNHYNTSEIGESNKQNFQSTSDNVFKNVISNPYKFNNSISDYVTYNPISSTFVSDKQESSFNRDIQSDSNGQSLIKTRSRSVPDIVKELDEEVAEARLKARERSHNCSPAPPTHIQKLNPSSSRHIKEESLSNPFDSLSPKLQLMCKFIHGMGFPLDRVARACENFGEDDKKIIEYLLSMGQLMDLGFPESMVAKALLQHNCNRDKALDELIS